MRHASRMNKANVARRVTYPPSLNSDWVSNEPVGKNAHWRWYSPLTKPVSKAASNIRKYIKRIAGKKTPERIFTQEAAERFIKEKTEGIIRKLSANEVTVGKTAQYGGMAKVCCNSYWLYSGKPVVVKSISVSSHEELGRFLYELCQTDNCASNPHFPRIMGWMTERVGESSLVGKIVMEKFDLSLHEYLERIQQSRIARPCWKARLELMIDYACALYYLHTVRRIVHGDIHPKNLMIKRQGREGAVVGCLIDLGLSR